MLSLAIHTGYDSSDHCRQSLHNPLYLNHFNNCKLMNRSFCVIATVHAFNFPCNALYMYIHINFIYWYAHVKRSQWTCYLDEKKVQ